MSESDITEGRGLWLIGFRMDPDSTEPELYTLIVYGAKDRPVMTDGRIVFFTSPGLAPRAHALLGDEAERLGPLPARMDMACDIAGVLYLLNAEQTDPEHLIINSFNILFDLVDATGLKFPPEYKSLLYELADHLTFHHDFGEFITQKEWSRSAITNALLWCVGAIASKARVISS